MMYGSKPVYYDGIPLMITNVGDEPIEVSLRFNALRKTEPPIIYYNTTGKKSYKKWDLSNITLAKGGTLYLFGENSVVDSTFVVNGNSSIHLDGKLEALLQGQVGTAQFGNFALEGLFKDVTQLESVGDIMPQVIGGVNAPSGWSAGYRYSSLFENTGIIEIPNNFLKETALGAPHLGIYHRMFFGCTKLTTIPRDLFINQSRSFNYSYQSMFQNCSNLEVAADIYCQSQGFMTTHSMYRGCKKITDVKVFTKTLASNHCMQYFVADCDNLQSIDFDINRVTHWGALDNAMLNCKNLTKVSIKVKTWEHGQASTADNGAYSNWMKGVSPTGTFICPKELADATDGYYDEEGNFVAGVGRGADTVPAGWTIDYPIIDARDGDANAMALMAVIFAQGWSKNSLYMMKSEAEKVESIKTVFAYGNCSAKDYTCMQYFVNSNFPAYCFARSKMEKVTLPNTLSTISEGTFQETLIDHINLPDSITTLLGGAFYKVKNLKSIDFNKVTKLDGYNHFFGSGLESVYIPKTLTIGSGSFRACAYLESIIVEEGHPTYDSRENCNAIILKSNNSLIAGCNTTIIPDSVKSIGNSAFNASQISYIDIPASVTSIGWGAFQNCKSLQTVILRKSTRYTINAEDFQNVPATFYVPDELLDGYKTAAVWSTFADRIKPISELPQ